VATIFCPPDSMSSQPIPQALVHAYRQGQQATQRKTARVCTTGGFCFALYPD